MSVPDVAADLDDGVFCGSGAHIDKPVGCAFRNVNYITRAGFFLLAVVLEEQGTLLNEDQLRVLDDVQLNRRRACGLQGFVEADRFSCGECEARNSAALGSVRRICGKASDRRQRPSTRAVSLQLFRQVPVLFPSASVRGSMLSKMLSKEVLPPDFDRFEASLYFPSDSRFQIPYTERVPVTLQKQTTTRCR